MWIEVPPLVLSVIGGEQDSPMDDPMVAVLEKFRAIASPDMPGLDVHGDGVATWEVAVADLETRAPRKIPEWEQWFIAPMSTQSYSIYGEVPTDFLIKWIEDHGGDATPIRIRLMEGEFSGEQP